MKPIVVESLGGPVQSESGIPWGFLLAMLVAAFVATFIVSAVIESQKERRP